MAGATPIPPVGHVPREDGGFLWRWTINGPVTSRRLGTSLGINLLPLGGKVCSFDCPYCECGPTRPRAPEARWPSPDEVAHRLRRVLEHLPALPDWITFSGNGEPTLHPRFGVVVTRVLEARDALAPKTRVAALSNGLSAGTPMVRDALRRIDARHLKLDPGPPRLVNGAIYEAAPLVAAYRSLRPYTLQAMVVRGPDWDGSSDSSLAAWIPLVVEAEPDEVQLYSLARAPADPRIMSVPRERLEEMAAAVRRALPRCVVGVY